MIRINLLPVRQARKRQYGKQQLLIGLVILLVEAAVLFYFYSGEKTKLESLQGEAATVRQEVSGLEAQNQVISQLNQQKQQLENLARVLEELEANRAGPVQVLDEVKVMLNSPANDLERVSQQRRGWDTSWNPRALWLSSFAEQAGQVTVSGRALSNDDIAEFNTRLSTSVYFTNVRLNFTRAASDPRLGRVYEFGITATVDYALSGEEG